MEEILCDYSLKKSSCNTLNCSDLLLAEFCGSRHYTENSIFMIGFHRSVCIFIRPYSILLVADPQPPLKQILLASVGPTADMLRNTRHHSIPPAEGPLYCKRRNKKQKGQKLM